VGVFPCLLYGREKMAFLSTWCFHTTWELEANSYVDLLNLSGSLDSKLPIQSQTEGTGLAETKDDLLFQRADKMGRWWLVESCGRMV
jgi:hypothetical protein